MMVASVMASMVTAVMATVVSSMVPPMMAAAVVASVAVAPCRYGDRQRESSGNRRDSGEALQHPPHLWLLVDFVLAL
jgi:hypothetical protein